MTKKDKKRKLKSQKRRTNEIRTNYKKEKGHPTYIYMKKGGIFYYLGITHARLTRGIKNIRLSDNPNPKDNTTAYVIPRAKKDKSKNFGKKHEGWKISRRDKRKLKKIKRHR